MEVKVRDPVHNFITLREREVKLLRTRALQRLRGIRQLAMANLVYPGALHTRFDHTLGVTHVAAMMAKALGLNDDDSELVRIAAMLHDIGHGPFSHVSEHALNRYADRTKLAPEQKQEKIHEIITANMIQHNEEVVHILGHDTCERVVKLLGAGHGDPALRSIVSGPLDADKQDYLLRDSRFCGVQYGVFDIHQLHRSLVLVGPDNEKELMIDPDGVHAVEQYVLAKYYLTSNVYRHKVRLITDQMIVRAISLGVEKDGNRALAKLYGFDNSDKFVANYAGWDDARFLLEFESKAKSGLCREMLSRLRQRRLLKRVFAAKIKEFNEDARELLMALPKKSNDSVRRKIEVGIAKELRTITGKPVDADFVIAFAFDIKSVRESSRNDEAGILVAKHNTPIPFEDESMLFASISEGYVEKNVEVYAPVDWETETDKRRIIRESRNPVQAVIESCCSEARESVRKKKPKKRRAAK